MSLTKAREFREDARRLFSRQQELLDRAEEEDRGLDADEESEWDRLHEEQEELIQRAERLEEVEERREAYDEPTGTVAGQQDIDPDVEERRRERESGEDLTAEERKERDEKLFEFWARYGMAGLTPEGREIMARRRQVYETRDVPEEIRALAVGVDTKGGFTIPTSMRNQIVEARKAFGGIRRARVNDFSTESGNPMQVPTDDDTSNKGEIVGENKTRDDQDVTFGQVVLYAYLYHSKFIKVSVEMLQDAEFDLLGFIARKAGQRIGRITAEHFTTGSGSSQPEGVVEFASVGQSAGAVALDADDFYELKHAVDPDYRENAEWMFNDSVLKELKKLKDGEGRTLWQSGIATGEPNSIDGDPYVVNIEMPNIASSNKAVLYGDFMNYWIRDVRDVSLIRLDERFADQGQVAFLAFSRHDGKGVDAGTNPIQAIQY